MRLIGFIKNKIRGPLGQYNFFGFALYDMFHLSFGTALLIANYMEKPNYFEVMAAFYWTELAFSILLISFLKRMVESHEDLASSRMSYGYAWLTASMAQFLPVLFLIPVFLEEKEAASFGFSIAGLVVSAFAFLCIFISLNFARKEKPWLGFLTVGVIAFSALLPLSMLETAFNNISPLIKTLTAIKDVGILFPSVFCILGVIFHKGSPGNPE